MPRCSECGKWGLFLKLNQGRCPSCHQVFVSALDELQSHIKILKDALPEVQNAKSIENLLDTQKTCECYLKKAFAINSRFHIVPQESLDRIAKIQDAIQMRKSELEAQADPFSETHYRRNWDIPLHEQFNTQNPSLSQEDSLEEDREFCITFLTKIRNELNGRPELNVNRYPVPRPMLSLRHPQAKALINMFDYFAFPNLSFLNDAEYMYVYLAHSQAGKTNDPNSKYQMNGFMQSFFPDHKRAIKLLFDLGFFISPDMHRTLHAMTIPQIRGILATRNIKIPSKSKKNDLIDLIVSNFSEEELQPYIQDNAVFELSDFGYGMVHSLYNDAGYSTAIEAPQPSPEELFEKHKADTLSDLRDYRSFGAEYFVSCCTLDKKTCAICGERDQVPTKISDAVIGYNAPPFHLGCRCSVLYHYDDRDISARSARDPVTNKSYTTTAKTYSEWIQRINKGER
ncbi:MAG: hypothetical protein IJ313_10575 [Clostridia bacterium]|nr:hypothetical protein [Clostridia bacterium]